MTPHANERRKAPRFPIEARVTVRKVDGESLSARAVNISSSGMLLHIGQPFLFHVGEEVVVEVELGQNRGEGFSSWGIGKVVRVDALRSAVQLFAGEF
jgi:PilZ domain